MGAERLPTTGQMREQYARGSFRYGGGAEDGAYRRVLAQNTFDDWLTAHDAEVARQQAEHDEFPWAVENRVVKGPIIALFRDRGEADEYVDNFLDLRVIRYQPEAGQ